MESYLIQLNEHRNEIRVSSQVNVNAFTPNHASIQLLITHRHPFFPSEFCHSNTRKFDLIQTSLLVHIVEQVKARVGEPREKIKPNPPPTQKFNIESLSKQSLVNFIQGK